MKPLRKWLAIHVCPRVGHLQFLPDVLAAWWYENVCRHVFDGEDVHAGNVTE